MLPVPNHVSQRECRALYTQLNTHSQISRCISVVDWVPMRLAQQSYLSAENNWLSQYQIIPHQNVLGGYSTAQTHVCCCCCPETAAWNSLRWLTLVFHNRLPQLPSGQGAEKAEQATQQKSNWGYNLHQQEHNSAPYN